MREARALPEPTLADVDADGKLDLVVVDARGTVSVLGGNGDGTFRAQLDHAVNGSERSAVVVADVSGDGRPDVVVTDGFSTVSVLLATCLP